MEMFNESQEEKSAPISFDARQLRAKLLIGWLNNVSMASANNDYKSWYQSLRTLYFLCSPYVNKSQSEAVKVQLQKTKNVFDLLVNRRNVSQSIIDTSFTKSTDLVLSTFKDQFMMTHKEEGIEFNANTFDGGVD